MRSVMTGREGVFSAVPRNPEKTVDEMAFSAFVALFALGLIFELQRLLPVIATLHLRQVLIALLLVTLVRARGWRIAPPLLAGFLLLCAAVGAATALRFGPSLAGAGFARF